MIQRRGVPAGLWYGNGLPHLCHYGQSGYGRCGAKGTQHPCIPTCILEMLLGWHLHGVIQRAVQQFHDHFNSLEPTIKFTIEMEQEGSLPFLDTRVTRNSDGSLTTTVFTQKTHLDWYLDFDSHHPQAHNVAVAQTLPHSGRLDLHMYPRQGC